MGLSIGFGGFSSGFGGNGGLSSIGSGIFVPHTIQNFTPGFTGEPQLGHLVSPTGGFGGASGGLFESSAVANAVLELSAGLGGVKGTGGLSNGDLSSGFGGIGANGGLSSGFGSGGNISGNQREHQKHEKNSRECFHDIQVPFCGSHRSYFDIIENRICFPFFRGYE